MANEQNLKRFTSEEAKINGQKGGLASGCTRRRKKCVREALETLLYMPATDREDLEKAAGMGFSEKEIDNLLLVVIGLFQKAKNGDVSAIKQIVELTGSKNESEQGRIILQLVDDLRRTDDV